jgi:hypothetical protein
MNFTEIHRHAPLSKVLSHDVYSTANIEGVIRPAHRQIERQVMDQITRRIDGPIRLWVYTRTESIEFLKSLGLII